MRAPLQILVLLYRHGLEFCVFRRSDDVEFWQGVAGGGEDDETPEQAAVRELTEETGLLIPLTRLQSMDTVPIAAFRHQAHWPTDLYVVPQYTFAGDATGLEITLSAEHHEYRWADYATAYELLRYQSNKNALWELNERLTRGVLPGSDLGHCRG